MSYLDYLPEDVLNHIYHYVYNDCLEELRINYTRKWIEKFMCQDCKPITINDNTSQYHFNYPDKFPFRCAFCDARMCVYCYIRNSIRCRLGSHPNRYGLCKRCSLL